MTTITINRATVEQALEYIVATNKSSQFWLVPNSNLNKTVTALRAALARQAEPVEQPYCYVYEYDGAFGLHREFYPKAYNGHKPDRTVPLYTSPPQRKPLPNHDQHCVDVPGYGLMAVRLVRAVERAHGITDPQVEDRLARHGIPMPEGDPK